MKLEEAYKILKKNVRYSHSSCEGFVYLSQIEELLAPKYNQELIEKYLNNEINILVDDEKITEELINFIYPKDPYIKLEQQFEDYVEVIFNVILKEEEQISYFGKGYWGRNFIEYPNLKNLPTIKASQFINK